MCLGWGYAMYRCLHKSQQGIYHTPGAGDLGSCELPEVSAGNGFQILCKTTEASFQPQSVYFYFLYPSDRIQVGGKRLLLPRASHIALQW